MGKKLFIFIPAIVFILVILFLFNPAETRLFAPCPFHYLTKLYCPGCGSLRAIHQLLHGKIIDALDLNPLAVSALPFLLIYFCANIWAYLRSKPAPFANISSIWIWVTLAVIIAFWILRNIPVYPFTFLAP